MKVNILLQLIDRPYGGSHQFIRALKQYFKKHGCYEEDISKADVFLFSSYQDIEAVIEYKRKYPDNIFVHRIDGPIRLYNRMGDKRDSVIYAANLYIADATIFQSEWSKQENSRLGLKRKHYEKVVLNAPDPDMFNRQNKFSNFGPKVRLIATSWSSNWKKGFGIYQWLDEHLNFDRYQMTFVGNSPIQFKNIKHIPPLPSEELSLEIKGHDIFIAGSEKDPCSNALIEGLHCGLPAVALNDGGHPKIVGRGGVLFDRAEEIPNLIERIVKDYSGYQQGIRLPDIDDVGKLYYDFMSSVYEAVLAGDHKPNRFSTFQGIALKRVIWAWRMSEKVVGLRQRIKQRIASLRKQFKY